MKVSFDFDGTLATKHVQKYAKELVDKGYEVHLVTARYDSIEKYSKQFMLDYGIKDLEKAVAYLYEVADEIGIQRDRIHFMNMMPKWLFFKDNKDFLWHLDDDRYELMEINGNTRTVGISCVGQNTWINKCNKLLSAHNE